jgi:hypothetical protein
LFDDFTFRASTRKNSPSILIATGVKAHELLRAGQHKARLPAFDQLTFFAWTPLNSMASSRTTLPGFAGLAVASGLLQLGWTENVRWPLPRLPLSGRGDRAHGVAMSCDNIRDCALRLDRLFSSTLKRRRPPPGGKRFVAAVLRRSANPAGLPECSSTRHDGLPSIRSGALFTTVEATQGLAACEQTRLSAFTPLRAARRAVQRCWMGCTEAALLHTRGRGRRQIARGVPEPGNV